MTLFLIKNPGHNNRPCENTKEMEISCIQNSKKKASATTEDGEKAIKKQKKMTMSMKIISTDFQMDGFSFQLSVTLLLLLLCSIL